MLPYYFSDYSSRFLVYLLVPKPKHMRITQITHPHLILKAIFPFQHTELCDQGNWIHKLNAKGDINPKPSEVGHGHTQAAPRTQRFWNSG